jgi:hypothetical protein
MRASRREVKDQFLEGELMMRAMRTEPGRLKLLDQSFSGDAQTELDVFESAEKLYTVAQNYDWVDRLNGETVAGGEYTLDLARQDFEAAGQVGHCYECNGEVTYRDQRFACGCAVLEPGSEDLHPAWNLTLVTVRRLRGQAAGAQ